MAVYAIGQITFKDRERYGRYARRLSEMLAARGGGELLAADNAPACLAGQFDADRVVLLRFDDEATFRSFFDSDEYKQIAVDRDAGADVTLLMVRGL
jgi:uncharacterized protein (DUF1330 family)